MTYTKKDIKFAIQNLTECASTWVSDYSVDFYPKNEEEGLPRDVYLALSGLGGPAIHLDTSGGDGRTIAARMLEGAQLLREGWLPGEPLHWRPGFGNG